MLVTKEHIWLIGSDKEGGREWNGVFVIVGKCEMKKGRGKVSKGEAVRHFRAKHKVGKGEGQVAK